MEPTKVLLFKEGYMYVHWHAILEKSNFLCSSSLCGKSVLIQNVTNAISSQTLPNDKLHSKMSVEFERNLVNHRNRESLCYVPYD